MAKSGERRMLFDTRGRRRHVIKVVYAVLALLMGASLFLVVGPFNLGELVGTSSTSSASEVLDEQAERIEKGLAAKPNDEQLLLALARTRISAGNSEIEVGPETEPQPIPAAAREDFRAGFEAWDQYLDQAKEPNPSLALLVAGTSFTMAELGSSNLAEIETNVDRAAASQRIVVKQQPNLGTLSRLAIYEYFGGDFAAGDAAVEKATAGVPKAEAKRIEKQLDQYRERAKKFEEQIEKVVKAQGNGGGQGQSLFDSLGPPGSTLGE